MQINQFLLLDQFKNILLLTPEHSGRKNISWVNVFELLDELGQVEAGEMIITDGFDLLNYSDDFPGLFRRLSEKGATALAVKPGKYLHTIPAALVSAASEEDIALLQIPEEVTVSRFSRMVIMEIMAAAQTKKTNAEYSKNTTAGITPFRVICLEVPPMDNSEQTTANLQETIFKYKQTFLLRDLSGKIFYRIDGCLEEAQQLREGLNYFIESAIINNNQYSIGVSSTFRHQENTEEAMEQAEKALTLGMALLGSGHVSFFDNISLYQVFLGSAKPEILMDYSQRMLDRISEHDLHHSSDLLLTLEIYLQQERNIKMTASALGIHRHTLKNRLDKIEEITACPLTGEGRINYELALAFRRLNRIKS